MNFNAIPNMSQVQDLGFWNSSINRLRPELVDALTVAMIVVASRYVFNFVDTRTGGKVTRFLGYLAACSFGFAVLHHGSQWLSSHILSLSPAYAAPVALGAFALVAFQAQKTR